MLFPTLIHER